MDGWMDGVSDKLSPKGPGGSHMQTQQTTFLDLFWPHLPRRNATQSALQSCLDDLNQTWGTAMSCKPSKEEEDPVASFSYTSSCPVRERAGRRMDGELGQKV